MIRNLLAPLPSALALAALLANPAMAQTASEPASAASGAQRAAATVAIESALSCWARGMDLTLEGKADAALTTWNECYAHPDYRFTVLFQGQTMEGEGAAGRAENNVRTGAMFGYTGAYHFVSNVEVELTDADADAATASALQTADHFREDGTMERTYGVITVAFVRGEDGRWLATDETMDIHRMIGLATRPAPAAMLQQ